jgi:hypothetical protein
MRFKSFVGGGLLVVFAVLLGTIGWFLRDFVFKVAAEPTAMTAAELVARGLGDNHYVRLTEYELGEPAVVKMPAVYFLYFPVYARGKPAQGPPDIVFTANSVETQQQVDALRARPPAIVGVVENGMSGSGTLPPAAAKAFPGLDAAKVWRISEGPGFTARRVAIGTWIAAPIFLAYGLVVILRGASASRTAAPPVEDRPDELQAGTDVVPVYPGTVDALPPEVKALGRPEHVHLPTWVYTVGRDNPVPVFVAGVVILLGLFGLLLAGITPTGKIGASIFTVAGLVGLGLAALPFLRFDYVESYLVYRDALVIFRKKTYTVIRWDAIRALSAPRVLTTADGQKFFLAQFKEVQDLGGLYEAVLGEVRRRLLPPALAALQEGRAVKVGPLTVSAAALGYQGRTLSWDRIGAMTIASNRMGRWFHVKEYGAIMPWCVVNLNAIPNDWLLLDLIRRLCRQELFAS